MKSEGEYNAFLSKEFKKRSPELHSVKIADKFSVGISDFIIWNCATSAGLEVKFIKDWPIRSTTKILKHPFAGAQKTFLESIALTRNAGWGLIAVESEKRAYAIPYDKIPDTGNWTHEDFLIEGFTWIHYEDVDNLIKLLFDLPF